MLAPWPSLKVQAQADTGSCSPVSDTLTISIIDNTSLVSHIILLDSIFYPATRLLNAAF